MGKPLPNPSPGVSANQLLGWKPGGLGWKPFVLGWKPGGLGWKPFLCPPGVETRCPGVETRWSISWGGNPVVWSGNLFCPLLGWKPGALGWKPGGPLGWKPGDQPAHVLSSRRTHP